MFFLILNVYGYLRISIEKLVMSISVSANEASTVLMLIESVLILFIYIYPNNEVPPTLIKGTAKESLIINNNSNGNATAERINVKEKHNSR